ncbi:YjcZ family sporulation protein [Alkalihalobacterium alkalinitrilicum]
MIHKNLPKNSGYGRGFTLINVLFILLLNYSYFEVKSRLNSKNQ